VDVKVLLDDRKEKSHYKVTGTLIVRNTAFNITGQILPGIIGIIAMPFVIRGLGTEAFGILSLAWLVVGYFALFELGMGKATTKFAGEYIGQKKYDELQGLVWTSLAMQIFLGILAGAFLTAISPFLAHKVFKISPLLVEDAINVFRLLSISLPVIMSTTTLQGLLEAGQRFDLVNKITIPANSLNFAIPLFCVLLNINLISIVFFLVLSRCAVFFVFLIISIRVFPLLKGNFIDLKKVKVLFGFGGWVAISNVLIPLLSYLERFLIAALLSAKALAYYTPPYEIISRIPIIPSSLTRVLYPIFSGYSVTNENKKIEALALRSLKYILIIMIPLSMLLITFAGDILYFWLGDEFAKQSTFLFQILVAAVFLNCLAQIPFILLYGLGRPDIKAKFDMLEVPLFLGLSYGFITHLGLNGAAISKFIIALVDTLLLFWAAKKIGAFSISFNSNNGILKKLMFGMVIAFLSVILCLFINNFIIRIAVIAFYLGFYILGIWCYVMDDIDKSIVYRFVAKVH